MSVLAWIALALALLPLGLALKNLALLREPPLPTERPKVSILIPARDEAANIEAAVTAALAGGAAEVEVLVLDDHSSDDTAAIVERLARAEPRLKLHRAPPLPPGWNGKQHACNVLASLAKHPVLLFVDADVRLAPDAAARAAGFLRASGAGLVSGFPRERTGSFVEAMLIPLIHLLLLGYLPIAMMRASTSPGFGAACGQLMLADAGAYRAVGGHAAIRSSRHDGVTLPRAFRREGRTSDLFDATGLASCRMYVGAASTWRGFLKNADEGMATPIALPVWTLLLFGGHVLPSLLLAFGVVAGLGPAIVVPALLAVVANLALRALLAARFRQSALGVVLHPLSVLMLLALQWQALIMAQSGRRVAWRGRTEAA